MSEQRRLAAILVADVAGFSRLVGADETGTLARLAALRREIVDPAVGRHSGRLFKQTGDGFLVEFASAVEAVRCAIEIQQAAGVDALPLRLGIHVGDVVVQGDDLMGDGVNIAARIEALAEPGGIAVSRAVHEQVLDRLDARFEDKGEVALKNIARPVRVFAIAAAAAPAATPTKNAPLTLPDKPSIAVLPFANMSGDPEQEFFADGITEDIITELSRFHDLFVIARNSTFSYKGKSPDVRQVGRELGVRYVLEGSVRKAGNRVRVTAQLVEASTGSHLWAERYDRTLEDVFAVQEDVTRGIVGAVAPTTLRTDLARATRMAPADLPAYGLAQKAWSLMLRDGYRSAHLHHDEAAALARKALARDRDCVLAMVTLATCHWWTAAFSPADQRADALRQGLDLCDRALAVDPGDHTVHQMKGVLLHSQRAFDPALASLGRAHEINPNDAHTLLSLGWVEGSVGETETAIAHLLAALRRDPVSPMRRNIHFAISQAYFVAGDYTAGLEWAVRADGEDRDYPPALGLLLLHQVGLGQESEARQTFTRLERIAPEFVRIRLEGSGGGQLCDEAQQRSRRFWRIAAGVEKATQ